VFFAYFIYVQVETLSTMGIPGLLPALKSITTTVHINTYAGKKVAVDAYSWLHKGAYSCSKELCEGGPTDKCVLKKLTSIILLYRRRECRDESNVRGITAPEKVLVAYRCINYCMQRVELLRSNGVVPVVVFDGGRLPMKSDEEFLRKRHDL
jgi:exonuclease 1